MQGSYLVAIYDFLFCLTISFQRQCVYANCARLNLWKSLRRRPTSIKTSMTSAILPTRQRLPCEAPIERGRIYTHKPLDPSCFYRCLTVTSTHHPVYHILSAAGRRSKHTWLLLSCLPGKDHCCIPLNVSRSLRRPTPPPDVDQSIHDFCSFAYQAS